MGLAEYIPFATTTALVALRTGLSSADTGSDVARILIWCAIFIGLLIAGIAVGLWYRRRMQDETPAPKLTFSLAELRDMRDSGEINEQEFERLRSRLVKDAKSPTNRAQTSSRPAVTPVSGLAGDGSGGTLWQNVDASSPPTDRLDDNGMADRGGPSKDELRHG